MSPLGGIVGCRLVLLDLPFNNGSGSLDPTLLSQGDTSATMYGNGREWVDTPIDQIQVLNQHASAPPPPLCDRADLSWTYAVSVKESSKFNRETRTPLPPPVEYPFYCSARMVFE